MAENIIKASNLDYIIIRPRGLFGIGDTSIIPRLLELNKKWVFLFLLMENKR